MILPTIAIIGRPNVGKSTLVNRLCQSNDAIVFDKPGVTRDRTYQNASWGGKDCLLYTSPSPRDQVVSRMPSSA